MYANTKEDCLQVLCQATSEVLVKFFLGMCGGQGKNCLGRGKKSCSKLPETHS